MADSARNRKKGGLLFAPKLEALAAPAGAPTAPADGLVELSPAELAAWPGLNPRKRFDETRVRELAASIRTSGVLQNLVVHDTGEAVKWVVAGETRMRAVQLLAAEGVEVRVPCRLKVFTEAEALKIAITENAQRGDLTVIEEARGYARLLELTGASQRDLAADLGLAQPTIANRIRLLDLPEDVLQLIEEKVVSQSIARDYLVPFGKLREDLRARFFESVVGRLRTGDREWSPDAVHREVIAAARTLARPIAYDGVYTMEPARFDAKLHEECTCGAPAFRWSENRYVGAQPAVRCFDLEWWDAAQKAAIQAEADQKAAAIAKAQAKASTLQGKAVLSPAELEKLLPDYQDRTEIAYAGEISRYELYDPSEIPAESLVWVRRNQDTKCLALFCTDRKAARKAKLSASRELGRRLTAKREELVEQELREVDGAALEGWMLTRLLALVLDGSYDTRQKVEAAAEDLDLGKVTGSASLSALAVANQERLAKLVALRALRGEMGYGAPKWEEEVKSRFREDLAKLLPAAPEVAHG